MGLQPVKTTLNSGIPVFQDVEDTASGGFVLDTTNLPASGTVVAGHPINFDESTRKAKPVKVAEVYANATNTATTIQVKKNHLFVVGDYVARTAGGAAYAITVIDTSNAAYDTITIGTTLGVALTAGDVIFKSSATGASAAAHAATPQGVLYEDTDIGANDLAVVLSGRVYERRVPKAHADYKAAMPNIIYSQSY